MDAPDDDVVFYGTVHAANTAAVGDKVFSEDGLSRLGYGFVPSAPELACPSIPVLPVALDD